MVSAAMEMMGLIKNDLPPDVRQQVLRDSRAEVRERNDEIVAAEQAGNGRTPAQRRSDCLERQGNILANEFPSDGTFADHWGGQVAGTR